MFNDTIAAISTPSGWGGIGIVRISGDDTFEVIQKIFASKKPYKIDQIKSHTIKYGNIVNPINGEIIDEVLVSFFMAPHTYTCENIAEINCHGGALIVKKVLELVLSNGARLAEPGEFTKRAFLNGRIDLTQAEAVIDVINAKTDSARKASLNQLEGKLSSKLKEIRSILIESIADIEAAIDYPEYDIEEISKDKLISRINDALLKIEKLIKTFFEGKIIRDGIETAIIGKPNVGKSSLLNALSQKEKAIITEVPGTTRDIIEEYIEIGGVAIKIVDTAGLRDTSDLVEKLGIDKAKAVLEKADLILLVLDGSKPIDENDKAIFELVRSKNIIVLINKSDLEMALNKNEILKAFENPQILEISAKEEAGLELVEKAIQDMFLRKELNNENTLIVTNIRHKHLIENAKNDLIKAKDALMVDTPVDIVSVTITQAAMMLGEITGETVQEDVLHNIFSKFCIGK